MSRNRSKPPEPKPPRDAGDAGDAAPPNSTRDALMHLGQRGVTLFHDKDGRGYAEVETPGGPTTMRLRSRAFRRWLSARCFRETRRAPRDGDVRDVAETLHGLAQQGPLEPVFIRVGPIGDSVYIDLADSEGRAVHVFPGGWKIVSRAPVHFWRPEGTEPLPLPVGGGSVDEVREFVNVASIAEGRLLVAWMLYALRGAPPFPILGLHGEQGTGKTTAARVVGRLTDPRATQLRAFPRDERELYIAATRAHVLSFDNLSGLRPWEANALCRLATGGTYTARLLYEDDEELILDAIRPIVLTGIEEISGYPDLLDRSIVLVLRPISERSRRPDSEFWQRFDEAKPRLFGALLDALAGALPLLPDVNPGRLPRMAEFAQFAFAVEKALGWPVGSILKAYRQNIRGARLAVVSADPVFEAVSRLLDETPAWEGTATEADQALRVLAGDAARPWRGWPGDARALSHRLRMLAPALREAGIDFHVGSGRKRRTLYLRRKRHQRHQRHLDIVGGS